MLFPWRALNGRHLDTTKCTRGVERKRRWIAEEELQERLDRDFQAYGAPLVMRLYKLQMIFIKKHYFGVTSEMAKALLVGWDIE